MTDIWERFDRAEAALSRISLLAQLRDKVAWAHDATLPRCGRCSDWMKSKICPRERNINGISRGPSCNTLPCDQFSWDRFHQELATKKADEAIAFATEHGLPVPEHLESKS